MPLSKIVAKSITDDTITATQLADSTFSKNMLHNGSMIVAQRGSSSTSSGYQTCDRWIVNVQNTDQLVFEQHKSGTAPDGFERSLRLEVTTAETALADDELVYFRQVVEARNCQELGFGTSGAKSLTLSFYVRSSLAGKYSVLFYVQDSNRSNLQSFTINTADTWEYKTITIPGDTSGSEIADDNGYGLGVHFTLAAGANYTGTPHSGWGAYSGTDDFAFSDQVNFIAQTGNFYLTGVQLQTGTEATPFQYRSYGEELLLCQRYYFKHQADTSNDGMLATSANWNGTSSYGMYQFPVEMKNKPSGSYSALADFTFYTAGQTRTPTQMTLSTRGTGNNSEWHIDWSSSMNQGDAGWLRAANTSCSVQYSAEF